MSEKRYPKEIILKDHKQVTLRLLAPEDRELLVDFYREMDISFKWYLKEDPCSLAVIDKWINRHQEGRAFAIVACHEARIVAHAGLLLRPYGARRHIGRLRIIVVPEFSHKQLGTWMIFDLVKRAMEMGLERIRIDFVVGIDDYAIKAVQKLDFVKEGLLRDYIQDENGEYHDYQIMVKQLHKDWGDF
jgi:RimJ/RimL family protein N-acetyltransferase